MAANILTRETMELKIYSNTTGNLVQEYIFESRDDFHSQYQTIKLHALQHDCWTLVC